MCLNIIFNLYIACVKYMCISSSIIVEFKTSTATSGTIAVGVKAPSSSITGADPGIFVRGVQPSEKKIDKQKKKKKKRAGKGGEEGRDRYFSIYSALVWSTSNLAIVTAFKTISKQI